MTGTPEVKNYAVIDDHPDMLPDEQPHFGQVQFTTGLMSDHMSLAAAILDRCMMSPGMMSPASQETVWCEELPLAT